MSTTDSGPQVRVAGSATPSGEPCVGRLVDEAWDPAFNNQDRDVVRVDVGSTTIKASAEEVEEL